MRLRTADRSNVLHMCKTKSPSLPGWNQAAGGFSHGFAVHEDKHLQVKLDMVSFLSLLRSHELCKSVGIAISVYIDSNAEHSHASLISEGRICDRVLSTICSCEISVSTSIQTPQRIGIVPTRLCSILRPNKFCLIFEGCMRVPDLCTDSNCSEGMF